MVLAARRCFARMVDGRMVGCRGWSARRMVAPVSTVQSGTVFWPSPWPSPWPSLGHAYWPLLAHHVQRFDVVLGYAPRGGDRCEQGQGQDRTDQPRPGDHHDRERHLLPLDGWPSARGGRGGHRRARPAVLHRGRGDRGPPARLRGRSRRCCGRPKPARRSSGGPGLSPTWRRPPPRPTRPTRSERSLRVGGHRPRGGDGHDPEVNGRGRRCRGAAAAGGPACAPSRPCRP